jgi:hypothetical protein
VIELPNAYEFAHPQGGRSQSRATPQSGLVKACSKHNNFTTWRVCLLVFLISLHPRWILLHLVGRTVGKDVAIHWRWGGLWCWVWGEHWGEMTMGGDDFNCDTWCVKINNESSFVGLMRIAG